MLLALLSCAPLLGPQQSWEALELPTLSRAGVAALAPPPLASGSHVVVDPRRERPARSEPLAPPLPPTAVLELLEGDALRSGRDLRVHRPAPPLLVRGDEAARSAARDLLAGLDEAGRALDVALEVVLVPGATPTPSAVLAPDAPALPARGAEAAIDAREVCRSGQLLALGTREERSFLSTFEVQVATGSGAPDPVFGSVLTGTTVHLTAWRVDGGRGVLVSGLLDLAHLASLETVDPGTSDLGRLDRPAVDVAQVAFSGRVASGGSLQVALRGLPLPQPDWTLRVTARSRPDAAGPWRVADLALLERSPAALPLPHPGAGVGALPELAAVRAPFEPLPAAALWGEVQMARRGAGGPGSRPVVAYAEGLLAGAADPAEPWGEVAALARAAEASRTRTATLRVLAGEAEVVLPVSALVSSRVLVGRETTHLTDYRVEIASETWMPAPEVSLGFDGALLQGRLAGSEYACAYWTAASEPGGTLRGSDTGHGRVERVRRDFRGGRTRLEVGAPAAPLLRPGPRLPALEAGVVPR